MITSSHILAIVIPYYKIDFFQQTLQSLANQTDNNFKVYIGNDASLDDPKNLLATFSGKFDFEYKEFSDNLGEKSLVSQWHRCLEMVKNEKWLIILGDDDVLGENVIKSFKENLDVVESLKIDVIRYSSQVIDADDNNISKLHLHPKLESSKEFLKRKSQGVTRSSLSEYCFAKEPLLEQSFKDFPLGWQSDLLAVLEVSNFDNVYTINEATVYFRLSNKNITSRTNDDVLKNEATFRFYLYILQKYDTILDTDLRSLMLANLEKTFLDNKKRAKRWCTFTYLYLRRGYLKSYFKFLAKVVRYILKKRV